MTLTEWIETTGVYVRPFTPTNAQTGSLSGPETAARLVHGTDVWALCGKAQWDLHHLADYVVSGCSGGTYWLNPRQKDGEQ